LGRWRRRNSPRTSAAAEDDPAAIEAQAAKPEPKLSVIESKLAQQLIR
jgi:hypothetical protein